MTPPLCSRGPNTEQTTLVFPISTYADPDAWLTAPSCRSEGGKEIRRRVDRAIDRSIDRSRKNRGSRRGHALVRMRTTAATSGKIEPRDRKVNAYHSTTQHSTSRWHKLSLTYLANFFSFTSIWPRGWVVRSLFVHGFCCDQDDLKQSHLTSCRAQSLEQPSPSRCGVLSHSFDWRLSLPRFDMI